MAEIVIYNDRNELGVLKGIELGLHKTGHVENPSIKVLAEDIKYIKLTGVSTNICVNRDKTIKEVHGVRRVDMIFNADAKFAVSSPIFELVDFKSQRNEYEITAIRFHFEGAIAEDYVDYQVPYGVDGLQLSTISNNGELQYIIHECN